MLRNRDVRLAILLFIVAFLIRVPWFWYPAGTVLDEGIYATYISNIIYDRPYFELHPPLAHVVFSSVVRQFSFGYEVRRGINAPFNDFPYIPLRFLNVVFGSLLAVVVFALARLLGYQRSFALIPGFGVVFDPALIIYSRVFLTDMMLLFFGFMGLALYVWYCGKGGAWRVVAAAVCLGAAFSVKWTGLAFLGVALSISLWRRQWGVSLAFVLLSIFTYISVFYVFFGQFSGGAIVDRFSYNAVPEITYPQPWNFAQTLVFLPSYSNLMYLANYTIPDHPWASPAWQWFYGEGRISMWDDGVQSIVLGPNIFGWWVALLSMITALLFALKGRLPRASFMGLIGYAFSFLPFLIISRPFFLYHYLMPLVFGWLVVPWALGTLKNIVAPELSLKTFTKSIVLLLVVGFALALPVTYGF